MIVLFFKVIRTFKGGYSQDLLIVGHHMQLKAFKSLKQEHTALVSAFEVEFVDSYLLKGYISVKSSCWCCTPRSKMLRVLKIDFMCFAK